MFKRILITLLALGFASGLAYGQVIEAKVQIDGMT